MRSEPGRAAVPVQAAAADRPVHICGAAARNAGNGEPAALIAERHILSAGHQRRDIGVVILPEGGRAAVGRNLIIADEFAIGMNALVLPVQVGADELALAVARGDHEHAVAGGAELRLGAVAGDPLGCSAGGRDAIDAGVFAPTLRGEPAAAAPPEPERLAVGRETDRTSVV